MKTSCKISFVVIALTATIAGCKKDANNNAFTGTWRQTKLHLYGIGAEIYDTTYLQPFTAADNIKTAGNSAIISTDHYYYPNISNYPKTPQQITVQLASFNYSEIAGKLVLSPQSNLVNPGGFVNTDTLSISGNTLLLHVVNYGHGGPAQTIEDSYYTKQ